MTKRKAQGAIKTNQVRADDAAQVRESILKFVLATGHKGVFTRFISQAVGRCPYTCRTHLRALAAEGLVELTFATGGKDTKWGAPGIRVVFEERAALAAEETRKARHLRMQNARRQRERAAAAAEAEAAHASWAEQAPIHVLVSAADAPMIALRGPASVWQLAEAV
jgi:hypothetical protein